MTDFGKRGGGVGATSDKQATQITAEEAIQAAVEALTKQESFVPVDGEVFDDSQSEYTSAEINSSGYRKFFLRIRLSVTNAPTTIKINVQFSHGGATYENLVNVPFGSLVYEDTAGSKNECLCGECSDDRMKINIVAVGTDATNKFTLTCKLTLTR